MKVKRILAMDQTSDNVQQLTIKNNTAKSTCGYITCAICQYLAQQQFVDQKVLKSINFFILKPYIEKVMQSIAKNRRMQIKKFMNKMNESQKKSYMTDWVANFQIVDYLQSITQKVINNQIYFFRQVGYDHPQAMQKLKFQQAQRIKQQQQFKGQTYFYTSFNPCINLVKQNFVEQVKKSHGEKKPIIIATDVLGHFNTTILLEGQVYVLDSLPFVEGQYDQGILQAIMYYHKTSYLKQ